MPGPLGPVLGHGPSLDLGSYPKEDELTQHLSMRELLPRHHLLVSEMGETSGSSPLGGRF